jgi:hypothetical protein
MRDYVRGLLASVARKSSWQLAEQTGHPTPDGLHHLAKYALLTAAANRPTTFSRLPARLDRAMHGTSQPTLRPSATQPIEAVRPHLGRPQPAELASPISKDSVRRRVPEALGDRPTGECGAEMTALRGRRRRTASRHQGG